MPPLQASLRNEKASQLPQVGLRLLHRLQKLGGETPSVEVQGPEVEGAEACVPHVQAVDRQTRLLQAHEARPRSQGLDKAWASRGR